MKLEVKLPKKPSCNEIHNFNLRGRIVFNLFSTLKTQNNEKISLAKSYSNNVPHHPSWIFHIDDYKTKTLSVIMKIIFKVKGWFMEI